MTVAARCLSLLDNGTARTRLDYANGCAELGVAAGVGAVSGRILFNRVLAPGTVVEGPEGRGFERELLVVIRAGRAGHRLGVFGSFYVR